MQTLIDDNPDNAALEKAIPGKLYTNFCERLAADLRYAAVELKDADMVIIIYKHIQCI